MSSHKIFRHYFETIIIIVGIFTGLRGKVYFSPCLFTQINTLPLGNRSLDATALRDVSGPG
jgi:hypothetical protein